MLHLFFMGTGFEPQTSIHLLYGAGYHCNEKEGFFSTVLPKIVLEKKNVKIRTLNIYQCNFRKNWSIFFQFMTQNE